jgi:predicted CopG family antitoxin
VEGSEMPATKTIKISEEIKMKLDEIKIHPRETYDDVIKRLIEFYESHKERNMTTISSEISSTNVVNTSADVDDKSDEPKTRTFCKNKTELRDVSRYVKWLKDAGVLIDWWDEETKYCFEVKE